MTVVQFLSLLLNMTAIVTTVVMVIIVVMTVSAILESSALGLLSKFASARHCMGCQGQP